MKYYLMLAVTLVLALTGCATTRTVDVAPTQNDCKIVSPVDLAEAQVRYQITLTDGRQMEATGLHEASGSLSWVDPDTGTGYAVPRSHVEALTYTEGAVRYCVALDSFTPSTAKVASIHEINTRAQRQKAQVKMADGASLMVSSLQVTPDSTSWMDPKTGHFETVATEGIREITFLDHGKGAGEGLVIGLLTGVVLGVVGGHTAGDDPPCECSTGPPYYGWECMFCFRSSASEKARMSAVVLGGLGGLLGGVVGVAAGHRDIYRLNVPVSEPQVASGEGRSLVLKNTPRRTP